MLNRTPALVTGLLGSTALVLSIPMTAAGRAPFVDYYYPIAWYGLILLLDSARVLCGRRSMIFHRPFAFAALLFWSAVFWFLFEAFDFRLANWYYVFVSDEPLERTVFAWLSFGTVLPALFLFERVLEDAGVFTGRFAFSIPLGPRVRRAVAGVGLLCVILPLAFPRYAFHLVWAFGFLLPLPWFYGRLEDCPARALDAGRPGRFLRILLAGLLCGFVWEFLNCFARTRWIYTVPFLESVKLFEMPPLGFLGFPPFALECTVLYGMLVALHLAPEVEGFRRRAPAPGPRPPIAAAAALLAFAGGMAVLRGMETWNIDSYTPRPGALPLARPVLDLARRAGCEDLFALRRTLENPVLRAELRAEAVNVEATTALLDLALLRGIGAENAARLAALGVRDIATLARQDPEVLAERFCGERDTPRWAVRRARVAVWIRAARRRKA